MKVKIAKWTHSQHYWVHEVKTYENVRSFEGYPRLEHAERWTVSLLFQDGKKKTFNNCDHISIEDNVTEADDDPKEIIESYKRGETPKFVRKLLDMKGEEDI